MICKNLTCQGKDLVFAGRKTGDLAKKYGTPLYLMDETLIRERMRLYRDVMREAFSPDAMPLYAGKACAVTALFRKPLGISFRTQILIRNRKRIMDAIVEFVSNDLLNTRNIMNTVREENTALLLIEYFNHNDGRRKISSSSFSSSSHQTPILKNSLSPSPR